MARRTALFTVLLALVLGIGISAAPRSRGPAGSTSVAAPDEASPSPSPSLLQNGDFEAPAPPAEPSRPGGRGGARIAGWILPEPLAAAGYRIRLSSETPHTGRQCAEISSDPSTWRELPGLGSLLQSLEATPVRDQTLRFSAWVRTEGTSEVQLWMRVDDSSTPPTFFEYEPDQPTQCSRWTRFEIVGPVAFNAVSVHVGLNLTGPGRAFLDDVRLEVVGTSGHEPPSPITARGLENLVAAARLLDTLRFFHPSDSCFAAPWDRLSVALVSSVEPAPDAGTLAAVLSSFAAPLAPSALIFSLDDPAGLARAQKRVAGRFEPIVPMTAIHWNHYGVGYRDIGFGERESVYRSWRSELEIADISRYPEPIRTVTVDLGSAVQAIVPTTVYVDQQSRTLPRSAGDPTVDRTNLSQLSFPVGDKPPEFRLSGNDRTTRLAAVMVCWSILRQFYPNFDLAACPSWDDALRETLLRAALDPDREAFLWTLRRMLAGLDDGHADVHPFFPERPGRLPLAWRCLEEQLIVTELASLAAGDSTAFASVATVLAFLQPGDNVVSIDGRAAIAMIDSLGAFISSPTERWRRWRAAQWLRGGPIGVVRHLTIERAGERFEVELPLLPAAQVEPRMPSELREPIREVAEGVVYADLTRIDDLALQELLSSRITTQHVILDLRGDPERISPGFLGHWLDRTTLSPEWRVPLLQGPVDRGGWIRADPLSEIGVKKTRWALDPVPPRIGTRVAFLMDERSISRAETYLAIARFGLGAPVVGSPSAGTLGNANRAILPGGFRITWTGMNVYQGGDENNEDTARLSGVGITPTISAPPTSEGVRAQRDEALERAIHAVSAP